MPRIVKKAGDVLKFPLLDGRHGYAQWLPDGARIFRIASSVELTIPEVMSLPVAFRVMVFNDTPTRYGWSKVGKADVPREYSQPQRYAKRDQISGALSLYFEGKERPATEDELRGLETAAVWEHPHIVERLEAELNGRESKYLTSVRVAEP
jgi:hypothetical protein